MERVPHLKFILQKLTLKETNIALQLQIWDRLDVDKCKEINTSSLNMSLKFDDSSEDGSVAFFKAYKWGSEASPFTGPQINDHLINFFRALELFRTVQPDFAESPHQLIHLRGVFQDMALPCFAVDEAKQEIGFNWKDLFSAMFKEEMQVDSAIDIHDVRIHFNAS